MQNMQQGMGKWKWKWEKHMAKNREFGFYLRCIYLLE